MSLIVVAVLTAKPGKGPQVIESFREVSPLVHDEAGCELYAAHLEQGGDTVVMVERWTTRADLDAHAAGTPLARLNELNADLLERPYDVWMLDAVPLGDEARGVIPRCIGGAFDPE
ncbi:putative quinol monooxygenase [Microcella sp.]|uniref:putative quinol monooxygenase n=1 Tax=Microcella sp. TaxID=1913979 RepID=UPI003918F0F3